VARQRGFQPRGPRRRKEWIFGPSAVNEAASATGKQFFTTGVSLVKPVDVTLARLRGQLSIYLTTASAVGAGFVGAAGIALFEATAFAAGVASVPGPETEIDWDGWIWHHVFDIRAITATIADGVNANAVMQRLEIDSKAMRKWNEDWVLAGVVEVTEQTTAVLEFHADSRALILLS